MDKIFSTRMDESVIHNITVMARQLGVSKKAFLERAVREYLQKVGSEQNFDVLDETCGSWQREESTVETVHTSKTAMHQSLERYKR